MIGPTSVASSAGWPTRSSRIAPASIPITRSAIESCTHSRRSAEQRWPALSKAEASASWTTCSGSAEASTIIAFCPPVSAISGTLPRAASERWMCAAASVEPVKTTAAVRGSATSAAPTDSPAPGKRCSAAGGTPASCSRRTASKAISGVCSAGLASTGLPAASAPATWPTKIASGKFHGLIATTGPSGAAGGACPDLRGVVAAEVGRLAHLADRVRNRLAGLVDGEVDEARRARLDQVGGVLEHVGALARRRARPRPCRASTRTPARPRRRARDASAT